jgi:hypothetical protein
MVYRKFLAHFSAGVQHLVTLACITFPSRMFTSVNPHAQQAVHATARAFSE